MIELTKSEIGMIIGALHLWRMEYDIKHAKNKSEFIEKIDNIINKLIDRIEKEKEQITFFKIIDNKEKR